MSLRSHRSVTTEPPPRILRLRRSELPPDTIALARFLVGKVVVREIAGTRLSGRIVEVEAYPPGDPASHHFRGPTPRIRSMYLHPGHAYVFFNYGMHFMLNVTSEPPGTAGAVLIRALEPLQGIERMREHRGTTRLLDLTRGPGRLASALGIDRAHDGLDLCSSNGQLWLGKLSPDGDRQNIERRHCGHKQDERQSEIATTTRIGISRAADCLLRFYEHGNPFVSGPRKFLISDSSTIPPC